MITPEQAEFYKRGWMDCLRTMYSGDELRAKFAEMLDQWIFEPDVKDVLLASEKQPRAADELADHAIGKILDKAFG